MRRRNRKMRNRRRRWKRRAPFCKEPQVQPSVRHTSALTHNKKVHNVTRYFSAHPLSLSLRQAGLSHRVFQKRLMYEFLISPLHESTNEYNSLPFQLLTGAQLTIILHCWCLFIELQRSNAVRIHSQMDWANKHKRKLIPRLAARNTNA
jgi:hypothetical protein